MSSPAKGSVETSCVQYILRVMWDESPAALLQLIGIHLLFVVKQGNPSAQNADLQLLLDVSQARQKGPGLSSDANTDLCNEDDGSGLIQDGAVHVDCAAQGQHKLDDAVLTSHLLRTLHAHLQKHPVHGN